MKIQVNQIRPGIIIDYNNSQWLILKTQHVKPGKGGAFNQIEMRDIKTGSKKTDTSFAPYAVTKK